MDEGAKKVQESFDRQRKEVRAEQRKKNAKGLFVGLIWLFCLFIYSSGAIEFFGEGLFTGAVILFGVMVSIIILNKFEKVKLIENYKKILIAINPVIPHFSSECLEMIKVKEKIFWPEINESYLLEENINFIIQINGKTRKIIETKKNIVSDEEEEKNDIKSVKEEKSSNATNKNSIENNINVEARTWIKKDGSEVVFNLDNNVNLVDIKPGNLYGTLIYKDKQVLVIICKKTDKPINTSNLGEFETYNKDKIVRDLNYIYQLKRVWPTEDAYVSQFNSDAEPTTEMFTKNDKIRKKGIRVYLRIFIFIKFY